MTVRFSRRRSTFGLALVAVLVVSAALAACEGGEIDAPQDAKCPTTPGSAPLVGEITEAIAAVEAFYGSPHDYFEISANLQQVSVIVATEGHTIAEQAFYVDDQLVDPAPIGEATPGSETFVASDVAFDAKRIFNQVRRELDCPVLIDFAITGTETGVIYDTTVASDEGGVLLVLLGPDGEVQGVQAS